MKLKAIRFTSALFLLSMLSVSCGQSSPLDSKNAKPVDQALVGSNPALALVQRFNLGLNLEKMAIQVSKGTVTYSMVVEKHGKEKADQVISAEVKKLLPSYQSTWNSKLANAYAKSLSPEELRSLAKEGQSSPHLGKFIQMQNTVGDEMKKNATPFLVEIVTPRALRNSV